MKSLKYLIIILSLIISTLVFAQTENLMHPSSKPDSELETQIYDSLEFWITGTGYVMLYGETTAQDFKHPKLPDDEYETVIEEFFATRLGFPQENFDDGFAHFTKGNDQYYLRLKTYSTSYNYTLLKEAPCPRIMTFPVEGEYLKEADVIDFPRHDLVPNAEGFLLDGAKYRNYDEVELYYDRKYHVHGGRYWSLSYSRVADDENSYRYITSHDFKARLLELGGEVLDDEDNKFRFRLGDTTGDYSSYNGTFSIKLVQEEAFKQSLLLTPDKIKTELDTTGKITLDGIYFDFNKATLKPESRPAILSTVALMQRYEDLVLAVHGHTDSKGDDDYNRNLSVERAAAVVSAIVAEGIDASRLQSRGFGEDDPIASNETDEGRAENRRVELHKVSGGESRSIITIDFIKPMENSVVTSRYTHQNSSLGIDYRKPHSEKRDYVEYTGLVEVISYEIMKDGQRDGFVSRREIVKNYENILKLYNARILGIYSNNVYFEITDRGDGHRVFGVVECYDGSYTIRFLIEEE